MLRYLLLALVLGSSSVCAVRPVNASSPAAQVASVYFAQVYDIKEGQSAAMRAWIDSVGGPEILRLDGVVSFETWVDLISDGPLLKTVIGFRDYAALDRFYADKAMEKWGEIFDGFIGPHKHYIFRQNPLYRSKSLSFPHDPAAH